MNILIAHNTYQQSGGEDAVFEAEVAMLRAHGHQVTTYLRHNDKIAAMSRSSAAKQALWSTQTTQELIELVRASCIDVIHAHNTFPLISPSLYWAAEQASVPVVQTLHNFRLMCLNGLFLREGQVCEDCLGSLPWRGVLHKCYRASGAASAVLAGMLTIHRGIGTYKNKVARYIALNEFCRTKFIAGGLPADRIVVKPNFVDFDEPAAVSRKGFLFVGRLSIEKGVQTLHDAASLLPDVRLRVAGIGPAAALLDGVDGITRLGNLTKEGVREEMNNAMALVLPSICYENFPRTIVEAFATGLPVIASRLGAMADLVRDGETGLLYESGNAQDLADKMAWALAHHNEMAAMGRKARAQYEMEFTAERNYAQLIAIYEEVIANKSDSF